MSENVTAELLKLNQSLLDSITRGDWAAYEKLCDPSITCFEPEALGRLVEGMDFHQFYFKLGGVKGNHNTTMCSPHVRVMGDVAVVLFLRDLYPYRRSVAQLSTRCLEEGRKLLQPGNNVPEPLRLRRVFEYIRIEQSRSH